MSSTGVAGDISDGGRTGGLGGDSGARAPGAGESGCRLEASAFVVAFIGEVVSTLGEGRGGGTIDGSLDENGGRGGGTIDGVLDANGGRGGGTLDGTLDANGGRGGGTIDGVLDANGGRGGGRLDGDEDAGGGALWGKGGGVLGSFTSGGEPPDGSGDRR